MIKATSVIPMHEHKMVIWWHCFIQPPRLNPQPKSDFQYQFPSFSMIQLKWKFSHASNGLIQSKMESRTIISFIREKKRQFAKHWKSSTQKYDWYAVKTNSCTNYYWINKSDRKRRGTTQCHDSDFPNTISFSQIERETSMHIIVVHYCRVVFQIQKVVYWCEQQR